MRYFTAYAERHRRAGETLDRRRHPRQSRRLGKALGAASALRAGASGAMLPVSWSSDCLPWRLLARDANMGFNIDAEEADRLDLSLDVIERVLADPQLAGWDGFGVVVQAYGPARGFRHRLARCAGRRSSTAGSWCGWSRAPIGIPRSSAHRRWGSTGFPVFTRKANTDVSYIANARKLLSMTDRIYPQFATHNAHTVAAVPRRWPATATTLRVPAPPRHGRAAARGPPRRHGMRPHLCAGRPPCAICSPISCAVCSRTAPTRSSSIS